MSHFFVRLGFDLVLGDSGTAAWAPRDGVVAFVEMTFLVDFFEKTPDHVVVFIGHGVVGVGPIHEVAEAFGLLGLDAGIFADTLFAGFDEAVDAVFFDVFFGFET